MSRLRTVLQGGELHRDLMAEVNLQLTSKLGFKKENIVKANLRIKETAEGIAVVAPEHRSRLLSVEGQLTFGRTVDEVLRSLDGKETVSLCSFTKTAEFLHYEAAAKKAEEDAAAKKAKEDAAAAKAVDDAAAKKAAEDAAAKKAEEDAAAKKAGEDAVTQENFERALAAQQQQRPTTWGRGRGIAIIVAENLDGVAAARNEEYVRTMALFMKCDLKVVSDIEKDARAPGLPTIDGDDTTRQGIRAFLDDNAQWLKGGSYVAFWFVGHGFEKSVQCQGGGLLAISTLFSWVDRGDRPLLAFIDACRGKGEAKKRIALPQSPDPAPALIDGQNTYIAYSTGIHTQSWYYEDNGSLWLQAFAEVAPTCADGNTTITLLCSEVRERLNTLQKDEVKVQSPSDQYNLLPHWVKAVFAPQVGTLQDGDITGAVHEDTSAAAANETNASRGKRDRGGEDDQPAV